MEENNNRQEEEENNSQKQDDQQQAEESHQDKPEPDVILDVPKLKVDEISLKVDDLKAKVSLSAKLADFVQIDVGADVHIKTVDLDLKGVEAEALLKVRLERVKQILNRTLETIDHNPAIIKAILEPAAEGAKQAGGELGEGSENSGEGLAEKAGKAIGGNKVKEAVKGIGDKISDMTSSGDEEEEETDSAKEQEDSEEAEISAGSENRKN